VLERPSVRHTNFGVERDACNTRIRKDLTPSPRYSRRAMVVACSKVGGLAAALLALLSHGRSLVAQPREVPLPAGSSQQTHPAPGSSTPTSSPAACFPACREGYLCKDGQCVSICNPPCPADQSCVGGRRCEPAVLGAGGQIHEI